MPCSWVAMHGRRWVTGDLLLANPSSMGTMAMCALLKCWLCLRGVWCSSSPDSVMQEGDEMQEELGEGQQSATATPNKSSAGIADSTRNSAYARDWSTRGAGAR